ncbi:MAG TPA: hypothetical protein VF133_13460 [Terriglobales bacterium]
MLSLARWGLRQGADNQIVEENLFYDLMGMLGQIGVIADHSQTAA